MHVKVSLQKISEVKIDYTKPGPLRAFAAICSDLNWKIDPLACNATAEQRRQEI